MKQKELLFFIIPGFLFVVFWIVSSVIHSATTSTITPLQNETINPITPSFDTDTTKKLLKKSHVDPMYSFSVSPPASSPASLQVSQNVVATPTPSISKAPTVAEPTVIIQ